MDNIKIEIFSGEKDYDLNGFDCGEESLNAFLTNHLKRQHEGKILRAYVLFTKEDRPKVLGYYTLSGSCFEKESLPSRSQQRRYLIGMFQVLLWVGWLWTSPFKVKDLAQCL